MCIPGPANNGSDKYSELLQTWSTPIIPLPDDVLQLTAHISMPLAEDKKVPLSNYEYDQLLSTTCFMYEWQFTLLDFFCHFFILSSLQNYQDLGEMSLSCWKFRLGLIRVLPLNGLIRAF